MNPVIPVLVGATVGALVTAVGWFVLDLLQHRRVRREAQVKQIERQIEELLGPVLGLVRFSRSVYEMATQILPNAPDVDGAQRVNMTAFSERDEKAWQFFYERYFIPINAEVRTLLTSRMHLLDPEMSREVVEDFLSYSAHSEARYRLWKEHGLDTSEISGPRYPRRLETEFKAGLDRLEARRRKALDAIGVSKTA